MDQAFPLVLHSASDQKLYGRKAWERGYTWCYPGIPSVSAKLAAWTLTLQRGGGVHCGKNELEALSCNFCPKRWSFEHLWSEKHTASGSKWRTHARNAIGDPSNVIHVIKWTRPPFLHTVKPDSGKAWKRGYSRCSLTKNVATVVAISSNYWCFGHI